MTASIIKQYEWPGQSPIKRVDVEKMPSGEVRMRLVAGSEAASLMELPNVLRSAGYTSYPDAYEGENVLMVRHVQDPNVLVTVLEANHFTGRTAQLEHKELPPEAKKNWVDLFKRNGLKFAGAAGVPGHLALMTNGILIKDWPRVVSAPISLTQPALMTIFGSGQGELHFDGMMHRMRGYLRDGGIELPELDSEKGRNGLWNKVARFVEKNNILIAYGLGGVGAAKWAQSGWNEMKSSGYRGGFGRFGAGLLAVASDVAVIALPEKKKNPAKELANGEEAPEERKDWIRWIKEDFMGSPLLVKGVFEFSNNMAWVYNAFEEHKTMKHQRTAEFANEIVKEEEALKTFKSELGAIDSSKEIVKRTKELVERTENLELRKLKRAFALNPNSGKLFPILSAVTAVSFISSTLLSAMSSKNRHPDYTTPESYDPLLATLANILLDLPKESKHSAVLTRNDALEMAANYLSTEPDVREGKINVKMIMDEVTKRMDVMDKSPFIDHKDKDMLMFPQPEAIASAAARA